MDLEDILGYVFVGLLMFMFYAALYERLKTHVPLIATTVKL